MIRRTHRPPLVSGRASHTRAQTALPVGEKSLDGFDPSKSLAPTAKGPHAKAVLEHIRAGLLNRPVDAEAAEPLGNAAYDKERWSAALDAIVNGEAPEDPTTLRMGDDALKTLWSKLEDDAILGPQDFARGLQTPHSVDLLRVFVRIAELHPQWRKIETGVWSLGWPHDDDTAAVLLRAAEVFGVHPSKIPFAGSTLAQYRARQTNTSTLKLEETLGNFDPSFRLAQALSAEPRFVTGVVRFLGTASLPGDVRDALTDALKLPRTVSAATLRSLTDRRETPVDPTARAVRELLWSIEAKNVEKRLSRLEQLQSTDSTAPSFSQVMASVRQSVTVGREGFRRTFDWQKLSPSERERLMVALTADKHPVALAVLAGLFTKATFDGLAPAFERLGLSQAEAETWVGYTKRLRKMSSGDFLFATKNLEKNPVETSSFVARMRLLDFDEGTTAEELFTVVLDARPSGDESLVARAVAEFSDFLSVLRGNQLDLLLDDAVDRGLIANPWSEDTVASEALEALAAAAREAAGSDQPEATARFMELARALPPEVDVSRCIAQVLGQLHAEALKRQTGLGEVDGLPKRSASVGWVGRSAAPISLEARKSLWDALSATPTLADMADVQSFAALEEFSPPPEAAAAARAKYPAVALQLDLLKRQLTHRTVLDAAGAKAKVLAALETHLGEALANATGAQKLEVFTAGRALMDELLAWYADFDAGF